MCASHTTMPGPDHRLGQAVSAEAGHLRSSSSLYNRGGVSRSLQHSLLLVSQRSVKTSRAALTVEFVCRCLLLHATIALEQLAVPRLTVLECSRILAAFAAVASCNMIDKK